MRYTVKKHRGPTGFSWAVWDNKEKSWTSTGYIQRKAAQAAARYYGRQVRR